MRFNKKIYINKKEISENSPVFIIAEAGVNHGGDIELAKRLISLAAEAGADAVKFQAFKTEELILDKVAKAPYQQKTTASQESQFEMLKKLEVTLEQNFKLKKHCADEGIVFLTTPFDETSLDELDALNLPAYKIASTDTTNLPFLAKVAQRKKPIFLSTGMSYLVEIEMALETIIKYHSDVVLLQCTANYPISDREANLSVINTFKNKFDMLVGYSDHTVGVGAAPFAVPMGAKVVEKHFTFDKSMEGPDHRASLSPEEFRDFVETVRRVEEYMGTAIKKPNLSETATRASLQKCLVAKNIIKQGEELTADNIIAKRTGGVGISPIYYEELIGTKAVKDFMKDEVIRL
ncbi:N-acetylneuraminate synthase [Geovibrio sp. ADMFC3]